MLFHTNVCFLNIGSIFLKIYNFTNVVIFGIVLLLDDGNQQEFKRPDWAEQYETRYPQRFGKSPLPLPWPWFEDQLPPDNNVMNEPPRPHSPRDGIWQPVTGTRFKFYVYSAFVEWRTEAAVRVIAATTTQEVDEVLCRLWLPDNRYFKLYADVQAISEHSDLMYTATFVLCLLQGTKLKPQDTVGATLAVVAVSSFHGPYSNALIVRDTVPKTGEQKNIHLCVKPLRFKYMDYKWMIEWMELNRLLGVSHFYMYNISVNYEMGCVLQHYQRKGLITLMPWNLPFKKGKKEIWTNGMFASINDCLYRSMKHAGWLLVIDLDEVVLPRSRFKLSSLIADFFTEYSLAPPDKIAAFIFRNVFFYTNWKNDPISKLPLMTSRKTRRLLTPEAAQHHSSKFMVSPREVIELGNHFIWEHMPKTYSYIVPVEDALVHHYRYCEPKQDLTSSESGLSLPSRIDRTAHRWSQKLWKRVLEKQMQIDIEDKCLL